MTDDSVEQQIDAVTWPRTIAYGLAGELLTASLLGCLRLESGSRGRDLADVRGVKAATWNRHIGDQAVNAGIVLLAVSCVPSVALFALTRWLVGSPPPFWVETVAALPAALGMVGLTLCYLWRRRRRAWTRAEVMDSLAEAARARLAWLLGGLLVAVVLVLLLRTF